MNEDNDLYYMWHTHFDRALLVGKGPSWSTTFAKYKNEKYEYQEWFFESHGPFYHFMDELKNGGLIIKKEDSNA
jgi:hypothetical protein